MAITWRNSQLYMYSSLTTKLEHPLIFDNGYGIIFLPNKLAINYSLFELGLIKIPNLGTNKYKNFTEYLSLKIINHLLTLKPRTDQDKYCVEKKKSKCSTPDMMFIKKAVQ